MQEKREEKKDPIVSGYQAAEISQAALSHAPSLGGGEGGSEKPGGNASGGLGAASDRKQIKKKRSNFNLYQELTSDRCFISAHIGFFREHWRFHNRIKQEATATAVFAASGHSILQPHKW